MGYISSTAGSAVQPERAVSAISIIYIWAPILVWALAAVLLFFYKLDKMYPDIMKVLMEREARGEL